MIKAHHHLPIYYNDGSGHEAQLLQLGHGPIVLEDVALLEGEAFLQKELLRLVAEDSALALGVKHDLFGHDASSGLQELFQPFAIEAHHHLAVDEDNRGGDEAQGLELLARLFVRGYVTLLEGNPLLRKELLRAVAEESAVFLGVDYYLLCHMDLLLNYLAGRYLAGIYLLRCCGLGGGSLASSGR